MWGKSTQQIPVILNSSVVPMKQGKPKIFSTGTLELKIPVKYFLVLLVVTLLL
jgi:hypothetical protein